MGDYALCGVWLTQSRLSQESGFLTSQGGRGEGGRGDSHLILHGCVQRPNSKELLKHRFIRNAKKNSSLQELIERHKRWKANGGDSGDDLSDNEIE